MKHFEQVKEVQGYLDANRSVPRVPKDDRFYRVLKLLNNRKKKSKGRPLSHIQLSKKEFIRLFKISSGCLICGWNEDYLGLDIDHINPAEKKISISKLHKCSWIDIFEELQKCQVLCAICHRYKTEIERLGGLARQ